jgi:hypothetical protein
MNLQARLPSNGLSHSCLNTHQQLKFCTSFLSPTEECRNNALNRLRQRFPDVHPIYYDDDDDDNNNNNIFFFSLVVLTL